MQSLHSLSLLSGMDAPTPDDIESLMEIVETLKSNKRINKAKGEIIERIFLSGDSWKEIVGKLLNELTHKMERGPYKCRICQVDLEGHICPYCKYCSTPAKKYEDKDGHVCVNCKECYKKGMKAHKVIQLPIGNCNNEQS